MATAGQHYSLITNKLMTPALAIFVRASAEMIMHPSDVYPGLSK